MAAIGLLAASPAIADVKTNFHANSYKRKKVLELVLKLKAGLFIVGVLDEAKAMSGSLTLVNQRIYDNHACENCAEKRSVIGSWPCGNVHAKSVLPTCLADWPSSRVFRPSWQASWLGGAISSS